MWPKMSNSTPNTHWSRYKASQRLPTRLSGITRSWGLKIVVFASSSSVIKKSTKATWIRLRAVYEQNLHLQPAFLEHYLIGRQNTCGLSALMHGTGWGSSKKRINGPNGVGELAKMSGRSLPLFSNWPIRSLPKGLSLSERAGASTKAPVQKSSLSLSMGTWPSRPWRVRPKSGAWLPAWKQTLKSTNTAAQAEGRFTYSRKTSAG